MKALFTDYFNISVSCSILIMAVLIVRFSLKKAPKSMTCVLWSLVFLRLVLPFRLESILSLRPPLPIVNENSTGFFFESALRPENSIPDFLPRDRATYSFDGWTARIDYVHLAAWIWIVVLIAFLIYIIVSYTMTRYRLRESVHLEGRVYASGRLQGGFLLGYLCPRIYLPYELNANTQSMIIAHEEAHRKRGDHWLKLLAFICLGIHWYNPFVWLAYILLCQDVEYACDEHVIRKLSSEQRIEYSTALLSVGKRYSRIRVCPLPFGESSTRKRVSMVLKYRKPAIWLCAAAAVLLLLSAVFLIPDPIPEYPPYYKQLTAMIGQPKEAVSRELGIELTSGENMASGYYETPLKAEYRGVEFDICLSFSIVDDRLWGFQYTAIYENNREQAASDTVKVAKQLQRTYGRATQNGDKRTLWFSEMNTEAVLEKFENRYLSHEGISSVRGMWDLSEDIGPNTRTYWEEYMASEFWNKQWEGRDIGLGYSLEFVAWNDPDTDFTYVYMDCSTAYRFQGS